MNDETQMRFNRAMWAYVDGEIDEAGLDRVFHDLADEAEARAAAITPDTKESAFERGVEIGIARGWRACAKSGRRSAA